MDFINNPFGVGEANGMLASQMPVPTGVNSPLPMAPSGEIDWPKVTETVNGAKEGVEGVLGELKRIGDHAWKLLTGEPEQTGSRAASPEGEATPADSDMKGEVPLETLEGTDRGTLPFKPSNSTYVAPSKNVTSAINPPVLSSISKESIVPGPAIGKGYSPIYGEVTLSTYQNADGTYSLKDPTRGNSETLDMHNGKVDLKKGTVDTSQATEFRNPTNVWGLPTGDPRQADAVTAHYAMQMTWDYLQSIGQNSYDGKGSPIRSYVHVGENMPGSMWDRATKSVLYGDGVPGYKAPISLDIAGHEVGHGVLNSKLGFKPAPNSDAHAISEALVQINGANVRDYGSQLSSNVKFAWDVGGEVWSKPMSMIDPERTNLAGHSSQYAGPGTEGLKVPRGHYNSGLIMKPYAHAVEKLGPDRMLDMKKVFDAAGALLRPDTTIAEFREQTIAEARKLFPDEAPGQDSPEVEALIEAWELTGIPPAGAE